MQTINNPTAQPLSLSNITHTNITMPQVHKKKTKKLWYQERQAELALTQRLQGNTTADPDHAGRSGVHGWQPQDSANASGMSTDLNTGLNTMETAFPSHSPELPSDYVALGGYDNKGMSHIQGVSPGAQSFRGRPPAYKPSPYELTSTSITNQYGKSKSFFVKRETTQTRSRKKNVRLPEVPTGSSGTGSSTSRATTKSQPAEAFNSFHGSQTERARATSASRKSASTRPPTDLIDQEDNPDHAQPTQASFLTFGQNNPQAVNPGFELIKNRRLATADLALSNAQAAAAHTGERASNLPQSKGVTKSTKGNEITKAKHSNSSSRSTRGLPYETPLSAGVGVGVADSALPGAYSALPGAWIAGQQVLTHSRQPTVTGHHSSEGASNAYDNGGRRLSTRNANGLPSRGHFSVGTAETDRTADFAKEGVDFAPMDVMSMEVGASGYSHATTARTTPRTNPNTSGSLTKPDIDLSPHTQPRGVGRTSSNTRGSSRSGGSPRAHKVIATAPTVAAEDKVPGAWNVADAVLINSM